MMLTVMLSTLLVLQTLFAERSSIKRKALSQAHTTVSAKHHQCQIHWWHLQQTNLLLMLSFWMVLNMLKPGTARTFSDYASEVFLPHVMKQLQNVQRLDVVWDEYVHGSLKAYTRSTRGKGSRRRVESSNAVPKNWMEFLRNDDNKTELFSFLSLKIANLETEGQIIVTHHKDVLCTQPRNTTGLAPSTHEEADTRMFLHVSEAVNHGYGRVMVRTVDFDVLVLAIAAVQQLSIDELWIAFGSGKSLRYLPAHEMAGALGPERCIALPFVHAFSGCDTVSSVERRLCGKSGKYSMRSLQHSAPWHQIQIPALLAITLKYYRALCSSALQPYKH